MPSEQVDILVRAFKAAWEHYFRPGRNSGVLECSARSALAEFLAEEMRDGIDDESSLAVAGLQFLFSLEDEQIEPVDEFDTSWSVRLESAGARFAPIVHARWHPAEA
jgi:hypothetical protein